jgi:hypothetical protein
MAKPKTKADPKHSTPALTPGLYMARQAYIDEADKLAAQMETKWGCGRLRLLVDPELRIKFDRQRYLLNQAIWYGSLEDLAEQSRRMCNAWNALDAFATAEGLEPAPDKTLELTLIDGTVIVICADIPTANRQGPDGRRKQVLMLDELARMIEAFPELIKAKEVFPGAEVVAAKRHVSDALMGLANSHTPIDSKFEADEIPF